MAYLLGCEAVRLEFPTAKIFDSLTLGVNDGDRIAQMVIARHERIEWVAMESLDETQRGAGGFGHTGRE